MFFCWLGVLRLRKHFSEVDWLLGVGGVGDSNNSNTNHNINPGVEGGEVQELRVQEALRPGRRLVRGNSVMKIIITIMIIIIIIVIVIVIIIIILIIIIEAPGSRRAPRAPCRPRRPPAGNSETLKP